MTLAKGGAPVSTPTTHTTLENILYPQAGKSTHTADKQTHRHPDKHTHTHSHTHTHTHAHTHA